MFPNLIWALNAVSNFLAVPSQPPLPATMSPPPNSCRKQTPSKRKPHNFLFYPLANTTWICIQLSLLLSSPETQTLFFPNTILQSLYWIMPLPTFSENLFQQWLFPPSIFLWLFSDSSLFKLSLFQPKTRTSGPHHSFSPNAPCISSTEGLSERSIYFFNSYVSLAMTPGCNWLYWDCSPITRDLHVASFSPYLPVFSSATGHVSWGPALHQLQKPLSSFASYHPSGLPVSMLAFPKVHQIMSVSKCLFRPQGGKIIKHLTSA